MKSDSDIQTDRRTFGNPICHILWAEQNIIINNILRHNHKTILLHRTVRGVISQIQLGESKDVAVEGLQRFEGIGIDGLMVCLRTNRQSF